MTAICVNNLVKKYKSGVQALDGLTLSVKEGEIFSLLGQNGAGKSTLINVLTTYLRPTSDNVTMVGKDVYHEAAEIRSKISCVAQRTSIDTHLLLTENMIFQSKLYKVPKSEAAKRMEMLISCFGLEKYLKYPVSSYSGGVKRRLDIALNLMSNPKVLFLDEFTVGMYIQSRMAMWDMVKKIRNLKRGRSDLEKTTRLLLERGIPFLGIEIIQPTLEDIFISLTREMERRSANGHFNLVTP